MEIRGGGNISEAKRIIKHKETSDSSKELKKLRWEQDAFSVCEWQVQSSRELEETFLNQLCKIVLRFSEKVPSTLSDSVTA